MLGQTAVILYVLGGLQTSDIAEARLASCVMLLRSFIEKLAYWLSWGWLGVQCRLQSIRLNRWQFALSWRSTFVIVLLDKAVDDHLSGLRVLPADFTVKQSYPCLLRLNTYFEILAHLNVKVLSAGWVMKQSSLRLKFEVLKRDWICAHLTLDDLDVMVFELIFLVPHVSVLLEWLRHQLL